MQQQNPPAIVPEQFTNVYGLGNIQAVYPVGISNRWVSAVVGGIMILAGGLVAVFGLLDTMIKVQKYGPVMLGKSIVLPLVIAATLLLIGILAVVNAYKNWKKIAAVYENGLAYADNNGVQTWNWADVEWLYVSITKHYRNGIYTGTTYLYTLQKADNTKLIVDSKFKNIETFGRLISQKAAPFQYQRLYQQVRNGQTVILGQVSINSQGITLHKKNYAWSEVESVNINNGMISVKKKDGGLFSGASVTVASTPNLDALLAVVDQFVKVKAG